MEGFIGLFQLFLSQEDDVEASSFKQPIETIFVKGVKHGGPADSAGLRNGKLDSPIDATLTYTLTINHQLLIYTSMKPSLLSLKLLALALNSLDTLSDVRIKAFTLLF